METVSAKELRPYHPRTGRTPEARLQWALDVCQKDLDALTVGDWANLQREFQAFAAVTITPDALDAPWIRKILAGEPWEQAWAARIPGRGAGGRPRGARPGALLAATAEFQNWPLPTKEAMRAIQQEWQRIIHPMLQPGGMVRVGPFSVDVYVERLDPAGRARLEFSPGTRDPKARLPLVNLLGAFAHRLRVCREPTCARWFVASRQRQTFCSRACQNRAAIRTYRARRASSTPRAARRRRRTVT